MLAGNSGADQISFTINQYESGKTSTASKLYDLLESDLLNLGTLPVIDADFSVFSTSVACVYFFLTF